jgi:hypothetical protein
VSTTTDDVAADQAATDTDPVLDRLAQLGFAVEDLLSEEGWQRWLKLERHFHRYSFMNTVLIALQRPDATRVAGYGAWKDLGRQVQRGEKSIKIWAPVTRRVQDDDGETHRALRGFKVAHVFDVSQTAGEDLAPMPEWPTLDVAVAPQLYDELVQQVAAVEGIDVWSPRPDEGPLGARGWYDYADNTGALLDRRRIAVRLDTYGEDGCIGTLSPSQRIKTLCHEVAHHFDPGTVDPEVPRNTKEIVAESVAWLLCHDLGLDSTETSAFYLRGWDPDGKALMAVGARIKVAYEMATAMLGRQLDVEREEQQAA